MNFSDRRLWGLIDLELDGDQIINLLNALEEEEDAFALIELGIALEDCGLEAEAFCAYEKAVELHPLNFEAHYSLAKWHCTTLSRVIVAGSFDEDAVRKACGSFENVLKIAPEHEDALRDYALCLGLDSKFDEAIEISGRWSLLAPDDVVRECDYLFQKGVCLIFKGGALDDAVRQFELMREKIPGIVESKFGLGLTALVRGDDLALDEALYFLGERDRALAEGLLSMKGLAGGTGIKYQDVVRALMVIEVMESSDTSGAERGR